MFDLKITIENDKVVLHNLDAMAEGIPQAIKRGLGRVGGGIFAIAMEWLRGAGGAGKNKREDYLGFSRGKMKNGVYHTESVMFRSYHDAGGYPIPNRTGHLRRSLDWLNPGQTKSGTRQGEAHDVGSITAGADEVIVYDSAAYASTVFEGKGSSAKFVPRHAINDAFALFNHSAQIEQIMGEEIRKETNKG